MVYFICADRQMCPTSWGGTSVVLSMSLLRPMLLSEMEITIFGSALIFVSKTWMIISAWQFGNKTECFAWFYSNDFYGGQNQHMENIFNPGRYSYLCKSWNKFSALREPPQLRCLQCRTDVKMSLSTDFCPIKSDTWYLFVLLPNLLHHRIWLEDCFSKNFTIY